MKKTFLSRLLSLSLALALCAGLWTLPAQAAEPPEDATPASATVTLGTSGDKSTLQDAYAELGTGGGTIQLISAITDPGGLTTSQDMQVTLDLNGFVLNTGSAVNITQGTLTVIGATASAWNINASVASSAALAVTGGSVLSNAATAPINVANTGTEGSGLLVKNGATARLNGTASGEKYGVHADEAGSAASVTDATGTKAAGEMYGVLAENGAQVDVAGSATATVGYAGFGAYADMGGIINVTGNAEGGMYGAYAEETGEITVYGNANATGRGIAGAHAENGGGVTVTGNATGKDQGAFANGVSYYIMRGQIPAKVTVTGNATATGGSGSGYAPAAALACNDGILNVGGDATSDAPNSSGAQTQSGGQLTVGGTAKGVRYGTWSSGYSRIYPNVSTITAGEALATATEGRSVGACAEADAEIHVKGDVDAGPNPAGIGAEIYAYGGITVDGGLKGTTYGKFASRRGTVVFTALDGATDKSAPGYLLYAADGWSGFNLRVKTPAAFVPATSLSLNTKARTLSAGASFKLTATVSPKNASNKRVTWSSGNNSVATVATDGTVKGLRAGTAMITATAKDGGKSATCTVTVYKPLNSAKMSVASKTLKKGKIYTFKPALSPSDATVKSTKWTSSNTKVAKVNSQGKVTAKKNGKTTISAVLTTPEGKRTTIKASVKVGGTAVKSVKLNKKTASVKVKKTLTLKAAISPANASNKGVTWSSSDKKTARVSANGKVTGISKGKAKITVMTKDGGKKSTCTVTVKN